MTAPLKALLVDDERLARKRLREMISTHSGITVVGEADSVATAAIAVAEFQPDVVFLDVEMPPGNGFELLPLLPAGSRIPAIVFVTAHEAFAVDAFSVSALDYLLKPICAERLTLALRRLQAARDTRRTPADATGEPWTLRTRVSLSDRKTQLLVEVGEIAAVHALGAYSKAMLTTQPGIMVSKNISEWERRLPADEFFRVDRSLIVQTRLIRSMEKVSRDATMLTLEGVHGKFSIGRAGAVRLRVHLDATNREVSPN